jgi:hypothetical protein
MLNTPGNPRPGVTAPVLGAMPAWARTLIGRANRLTPLPGFTEEDMMTVWERCEGRCAVSGLAFSEVLVGTGWARKPYAPSLDRIDRSRGYEPDNVRLVTAVANFAMNAWGLEPVLDLAQAMAQKYAEEARDPADRAWLARQDARIAEAEEEAAQLTGEASRQARRRIAALKRARTLGPAGLRAAAEKAIGTRTAG